MPPRASASRSSTTPNSDRPATALATSTTNWSRWQRHHSNPANPMPGQFTTRKDYGPVSYEAGHEAEAWDFAAVAAEVRMVASDAFLALAKVTSPA
jgi:hypothetical protein